MRLLDINDIWTCDTSTLPRSVLSAVYVERAKCVAEELGQLAAKEGKAAISRVLLAERIGCSRSTLSQNLGVRNAVRYVESRLRRIRQGASSRTKRSLATVRRASIPSFRRPTGFRVVRDGWIVAGGISTVLGQEFSGIPALVWHDGVDGDASDWFRHMRVKEDLSVKTVAEYANVLRVCLRRCRKSGLDWRDINDDWLVAWRLHLINQKRVSKARANLCIAVAFKFLLWAERTRRLTFRVGAYAPGDLPDEIRGRPFAVSAKMVRLRAGEKHMAGRWVSGIAAASKSQWKRQRHTPSEKEVRRVHALAATARNSVRNMLILSWAEETGARRGDLIQLKLSHLPSPTTLQALIEEDEPFLLPVLRKGRLSGHLGALPDLLIRTLDYVAHERKSCLSRIVERNPDFTDEGWLFVSERTGGGLHEDSVTSICGDLFKRAGVERSSLHRLRARFAVNIVTTLVDAVFDDDMTVGNASSWVETILTKAAEAMGHRSPASLKPYLGIVLDNRLKRSVAWQLSRDEARAKGLERCRAHLHASPSIRAGIDAAMEAIRTADYANALSELGRLVARFEVSGHGLA